MGLVWSRDRWSAHTMLFGPCNNSVKLVLLLFADEWTEDEREDQLAEQIQACLSISVCTINVRACRFCIGIPFLSFSQLIPLLFGIILLHSAFLYFRQNSQKQIFTHALFFKACLLYHIHDIPSTVLDVEGPKYIAPFLPVIRLRSGKRSWAHIRARRWGACAETRNGRKAVF